jgi:hypothetical protein
MIGEASDVTLGLNSHNCYAISFALRIENRHSNCAAFHFVSFILSWVYDHFAHLLFDFFLFLVSLFFL